MQQLGFDLSHLVDDDHEEDGSSQKKDYSLKASWLSKFLRLQVERINLNFGRSVLRPRHEEMVNSPVGVLITTLNHVDGQTRIRAKYD